MKRLSSRLETRNKIKLFRVCITAFEFFDSGMTHVCQEQKKFFADGIKTLQRSSEGNSKSKIFGVYSLLYVGVLCVGGGLAHANFPDETKYQ